MRKEFYRLEDATRYQRKLKKQGIDSEICTAYSWEDQREVHAVVPKQMYRYGMRLRGFSIGCQPMEGFYERQDDDTGRYHDILIYERKLTDKELADYELDYLGKVV